MGHFADRKSKSRSLAELIGASLDPVCAKRGFSSAAILSWWPEIVGPEYQSVTLPQTIKWPKANSPQQSGGGALTVQVNPGQALFFQHDAPLVVERINQFLGYAAVGRIKIVQMPVKPLPAEEPEKEQKLDAAKERALQGQIQAIDCEPLKKALKKLGESILLRQGQ